MFEFIITGNFYKKNCLPGYNDYIDKCRYNKYSANNFKKAYMEIINSFIPFQEKQIITPYMLDLVLGEVSHKRDKDNVEAFAKKLINDTLQENGTVENDKLYAGGSVAFVYGKEPFIKVVVREVLNEKI